MIKLFLSFIIPVYNTEDYIEECLNSLLNQNISSDEYEIICINDGSKDSSFDILNKYALTHTNIHVIDQQNSGVSVARNVGLENANGDYIWFIDSDDLIKENCLHDIKTIISANECDRIIISSRTFKNNNDLFSKEPAKESWKDSVVWRNIFKRKFLNDNNLRYYPGLVFGEDSLYLFECFRCNPKIFEADLLVYYHRVVEGSASNNSTCDFSKKRIHSTLTEAKIVQQYYERNDGIYPVETANRLMIYLCGGLYALTLMPPKIAKPFIKDLKNCGLYPYKTPKECTVTKSYQHNRTDFLGKIFDYVYTHLHRPWGFMSMRIINLSLKIINKSL